MTQCQIIQQMSRGGQSGVEDYTYCYHRPKDAFKRMFFLISLLTVTLKRIISFKEKIVPFPVMSSYLDPRHSVFITFIVHINSIIVLFLVGLFVCFFSGYSFASIYMLLFFFLKGFYFKKPKNRRLLVGIL